MQPLIHSIIRKIISEGFLNEISHNAINYVLENNPDQLPFDDLFDGQLRKVIPMESNVLASMKQSLEGHGFEVDVAGKKAFKTKETQRGPKKVEMRLGKAINSAEKDLISLVKKSFASDSQKQNEKYLRKFFEELKTLGTSADRYDVRMILSNIRRGDESIVFDDVNEIAEYAIRYIKFSDLKKKFEKAGDDLDVNEYSIILTRAPADVLRMSDHVNISSCHSEDGDYFQCAVTEAMRGGAIAYAVKTEDLDLVNLDDSEIFIDSERGVQGIKPYSRVRLRNFVSDEVSLAVPETRSYGRNLAGFKSTVTEWARVKQVHKFTDEEGNINLPDIDDFVLRGGTYADSEADELLNNLFDVDEFVGDIDTEDEDEEYGARFEEAVSDLENELSAYVEEANGQGNVYFYFGEAETYDEGRAYFSVRAHVQLELPEDVAKAMDELSYREEHDYIQPALDKLDVSYSDYQFDSPHLSIDIEDSDLETTVTPDDLDVQEIKDNIDYWAEKSFDIEEAITAMRNKLIYDEHLPGYQEEYAGEIEGKFKNFKISFEDDPDDEDFNVISATATISSLSDIKDSQTRSTVMRTMSKKAFVQTFFKEVVDFFKPSLKQLILPNVDYGPMSIIKAPDGASLVASSDKVIMNVHFRADDDVEDFIEFVSTMDNNLEIVEKILSKLIEQALLAQS